MIVSIECGLFGLGSGGWISRLRSPAGLLATWVVDQSVLLLNDAERRFIDQMIETWTLVFESDREGYEQFQFERSNVIRKLAGKYTKAQREAIGTAAIDLLD